MENEHVSDTEINDESVYTMLMARDLSISDDFNRHVAGFIYGIIFKNERALAQMEEILLWLRKLWLMKGGKIKIDQLKILKYILEKQKEDEQQLAEHPTRPL